MVAKPATGSLGQTPLCQLLVFVLEKQLTGSLIVQHLTGGKSAVTVRNGVPVKVRAGQAQIGFGDICVRLGLLDESTLEAVLAVPTERPFGEELQARGLLAADQMPRILEEQVYARLEWVAGEPEDTIYGFYEGQDFLSTWGGEPRAIDPLRAIWRTARKRGLPPARLTQVLAGMGDKPLRLHPGSRISRFGFGKDVASAFDVLRAKQMSVAELIKQGLAPQEELRQALAIVALCRHLDVGATPLGVERSSFPPPVNSLNESRRRVPSARFGAPAVEAASDSGTTPAAAATLSPELEAELRGEVAAKLAQVATQDYYSILGVNAEADANAIQAAFFALAKRWHPDRLPPSVRDLRPDATRIFARMTEAHQVLTNPAQRAEYERLRTQGATSEEEQQDVQRVLRAAGVFQKAELALKRADWAGAEKLAKQAHDLDPEQAEYSALYAWVVAKSGQRATANNYQDLLELLNAAVKQQKDNPRVRLYRAGVLKLAGQVSEALRDYRAVIDLEPNNVEASRELRLHKMRAEAAPTNDGLLSRFFKK